MRLFLTALLGASLSAALPVTTQAAPPGYRPLRHYYTPSHQPYHRLPVRLTFGPNLAYYNGDIADKLKNNTLRLGLGLGLTHALSPHLTYGLELSYLKLKATDQLPARGYSFASTNGLLTTFLRYNLNADKSLYFGLNNQPTPVLAFVQAGVGALLNNPTASRQTADGVLVLAPERRGGYPTLAAVLPVGGGVTLRASRSLHLTLEGLYYFTSTDLLDDVSQRGNPKSNDDFATVALKIEYAFYKKHGQPLAHHD